MISVTTLSSYLYCPRKLYLEKVLKIVKPPKEVLVKGSIRHKTYDGINKAEEELVKSIDKSDLSYISTIFKKEYSQILRKVLINNRRELATVNLDLSETFKKVWPMILSESRVRANNIFSFVQKFNIFGNQLWDSLTPKIKSEQWLQSENIELRGIVDQVQIYEGEIVPYELKTGKMPLQGVWPGHKIQIGAYMMLLQESTNMKISRGVIRYLDAQTEREIIFNPFLRDEVLDLRDKTRQILSSDELPPIINNKSKCKACELREKCYSM